MHLSGRVAAREARSPPVCAPGDGVMVVNDLIRDLRYAVRVLGKNPGFLFFTVAILALGIGANTAMFSVVRGILLRPLPFAAPDRLAMLWETHGNDQGMRVSPPTFLDWQRGQRSFEGLVATSEDAFVLTGLGEPRELTATSVSHGFFDLLGWTVEVGRAFRADDDVVGAERVVILSHGLAVQLFGTPAAALDRTLTLTGNAYRVVGVAPARFDYPAGTALWSPLIPALGAGALSARGAHFLLALGRLRPGVTLAQASAELARISGGVNDYQGEYGARATSLQEEITGQVRPALLILLGAVGFVLLIACANIGSLLLARASSRSREIAIRAALGASRGRLAGQFLAESLVLAVGGGVLGTVVAAWGITGIMGLSPTELPRRGDVGLDAAVLAFTAAITLLTGLLVGVLPALRGSRLNLGQSLKEHGPATGGVSTQRLRGALIVAEVVLSVVLLTGAGLLLRSFIAMTTVDPGFQPDGITTFRIALPTYRYPDTAARLGFFQQLLERTRALPGVTSAGLTRNLPVSGSSMTSPALIEGQEREPGSEPTQASAVTPGYFRAMGIRLMRGRTFTAGDRSGNTPVAIVDEAFVRRYLKGEDPIGKRARTMFGQPVLREIIGVVADVKHAGLTADAPPFFYTPLAQDPAGAGVLVVRSSRPATAVMDGVRAIVRQIDPQQPLGEIATMRNLLSRSVARPRFYTELLTGFAAAALLLAGLGFYAILASTVAQRRHEIGVRLALGARTRDILALTLGHGLLLTALGLALGIPTALGMTRVLRGLLFHVGPTDPVTFVMVSLSLGMVALAASYVPARRALRTDPLRALKD